MASYTVLDSIKQKKKKLQSKEKIILYREKRIQEKRLIRTLKMISSSAINKLDDETLLGALLEMSEKAENSQVLENWRSKALLLKNKKSDVIRMAITFEEPPTIEIKSLLKDLKFKWNSFRGEYHGFGKIEEIEIILNKQKIKKIEVIN